MAEFDALIRGGTVVDGTRAPPRVADVAIRGGRIAAVGRFPAHAATAVIDAAGLIVAPGAVDLHTHYDAQVHWDPYCTGASWHGITSVTVGNCGFGLAPVRSGDADRTMLTLSRNEAIPLPSMQAALSFTWETFPEWMDHLEALPLGINLSHLAPVSPIVAYAAGGYDGAKGRALTHSERRAVVSLLAEALDAGAVGWGAQRQLPGSFGAFQRDFDGSAMVSDLLPDDVYLDLAAALRGRKGSFIQFAQSTATSSDMIRALRKDFDFNVRLSRVSGRPVLYNAVAAVDRGPEIFRKQLDWIDRANARGHSIYAQGATVRSALIFTFEDWNLFDSSEAWCEATLGGVDERRQKLGDPRIRAALRSDLDSGRSMTGFFGELGRYTLHRAARPEHGHLEGRTIAEIAGVTGKHVVDALLDLSLAEGLQTEWATPIACGDPTKTRALLDSEYVVAGTSDGGAHVKFQTSSSYPTDLLSWLVRDVGCLSLEEAHYRLSALPASIAGFVDRGTLTPGSAADVVVYELERLRVLPVERAYDLPAGEWRRVCRAEGYHHVLVNGEPIFVEGRCTGSTPGRLLRHGAS